MRAEGQTMANSDQTCDAKSPTLHLPPGKVSKFTEIICEPFRNKVRARAKGVTWKANRGSEIWEAVFLLAPPSCYHVQPRSPTGVQRPLSTFNTLLTSPEIFLTPLKDTAVFSLVQMDQRNQECNRQRELWGLGCIGTEVRTAFWEPRGSKVSLWASHPTAAIVCHPDMSPVSNFQTKDTIWKERACKTIDHPIFNLRVRDSCWLADSFKDLLLPDDP